jgi:hypothetical protein
MTMTEQRAPTLRAANATPCAALPALTVHNAVLQLVARQLTNRVVGAANLERPDGLQHFQLQEQLDVLGGAAVPQLDANERRPNRRRVDRRGRVANGCEWDVSLGNRDGQDAIVIAPAQSRQRS